MFHPSINLCSKFFSSTLSSCAAIRAFSALLASLRSTVLLRGTSCFCLLGESFLIRIGTVKFS